MHTSIITTGKLPLHGQAFFVRFLHKEDIHEILHLQTMVKNALEVPDFLQPLTAEEYKSILGGCGSIIGVFVNNKLIAFRAMLIPKMNDPEHLGIDLRLNEYQRKKMLYSEISNVHPAFRGNRLQSYMGRLLFDQIDQQSFRYVATTVAPLNIASLKDKLALGMAICSLKEKYNGKLRYILFRDLHTTNDTPFYSDKQEVNIQDITKQQQLIKKGYRGFSLQEKEQMYWVCFIKEQRRWSPV
ncbi:GNAT family N-acetyltransferase [Virgibacillus sp. Bac330]|uniref:GNAT family N-acetyltransferase n=1 Tax=Virgibacillus sp. Bac330 TaxID=2419841 RepID=UPI000EF4A001|nr:GNAT family N-acetyltransferase [Virgibacillus sp. Bac330]